MASPSREPVIAHLNDDTVVMCGLEVMVQLQMQLWARCQYAESQKQPQHQAGYGDFPSPAELSR
jgi:hypothetical protein